MTQQTLGLTDDSTEGVRVRPGARAARGLVFVGLWIQWNRRISDLSFNTRLAEVWEETFDHWSIDDRHVHLGSGALGYSLDLRDGSAKFVVQLPKATLRLLREHAKQMIAALQQSGRTGISILTEGQYLEPVECAEFEVLMNSMAHKLLNTQFADHVGAKLTDLAYLVDFEAAGQWFQVQAGPLRASEIPKRVQSDPRRLGKIPEFARYYSVSSRAQIGAGEFDLDMFWQRVANLGASIAQELTDDQPRAALGSGDRAGRLADG